MLWDRISPEVSSKEIFMFHSLPRAEIVDREQYIVDFCAGKKVVHLGAAQGNDANDLKVFETTIDPQTFLHARITQVATHCVGIDYNKAFVNHLNTNLGISNILYGDIEDPQSLACIDIVPDVVVMGEIIEHISNPGLALSNIRATLMSDTTQLLVTMPNALDASNFLYGLFRLEAQDPSHVATYTPRLFESLCQKVGLRILDLKYYQMGISTANRNYYKFDRWSPRRLLLFVYYNLLLRLNPGFSNGLVIVAAKS